MENLMRKFESNSITGDSIKFIDSNFVTPEFNTFIEVIECKICTGIVVNPICCKVCDNLFCKNCIKDWLERRKNECPFRCKFEEFQIRPTTKNMIHKIKLFCCNKEKGCSEIIDYENYIKHLNNCEFNLYECIGCNMNSKKDEMKIHVLKCDKLFKNCEFCFEKFSINEIQSHFESCQMFELPCKYCSIKIKRYNFDKHLKTECKECQVFCEYCESSFKRKYEQEHTKRICFDIFRENLIKNDDINKIKEENIRLKKELEIKEQTIKDFKLKYEGEKSNKGLFNKFFESSFQNKNKDKAFTNSTSSNNNNILNQKNILNNNNSNIPKSNQNPLDFLFKK